MSGPPRHATSCAHRAWAHGVQGGQSGRGGEGGQEGGQGGQCGSGSLGGKGGQLQPGAPLEPKYLWRCICACACGCDCMCMCACPCACECTRAIKYEMCGYGHILEGPTNLRTTKTTLIENICLLKKTSSKRQTYGSSGTRSKRVGNAA